MDSAAFQRLHDAYRAVAVCERRATEAKREYEQRERELREARELATEAEDRIRRTAQREAGVFEPAEDEPKAPYAPIRRG